MGFNLRGQHRLKIVDKKAFDFYWIGKRPITKIAFLEWMDGSDNAVKVARKHGFDESLIRQHSVKLNKLGITKRVALQ